VPVFWSMPPCFTSFTTPTIVAHGTWSPQQTRNRCPIALSFGQYIFASVSFTSTAGVVAAPSCAPNVRPSSTGIFIAVV